MNLQSKLLDQISIHLRLLLQIIYTQLHLLKFERKVRVK